LDIDHLLFHLLAAFVVIIIGIYFARLFVKGHNKHYLVVSILCVVVLIGTFLSYFSQGKSIPGISLTFQLIILWLVFILIGVLLYFPEIKQFLNKRNIKKE
jgi:hypothetical protein